MPLLQLSTRVAGPAALFFQNAICYAFGAKNLRLAFPTPFAAFSV
jgi:hypothetical protein